MKPIRWKDDSVEMIDQRKLPQEEVWNVYRTGLEVAEAIRSMVIRGAPAIGIAAAYGLALEAKSWSEGSASLLLHLDRVGEALEATRPTAINLSWAVQRMLAVAKAHTEPSSLGERLVVEALDIAREDELMCLAIGQHGAPLLPEGGRVLTHCNAGALATGDYGTALGVIRAGRDRIKEVWVDETRPFLQGARLTAWELQKEGIPCRLICDNMAGHLMQRGQVQAVVVGADRITADGSVANKIGTYSLAVLCRFHEIPMYVAVPYSTIDMQLKSGSSIPIEERDPKEVTHLAGVQIAPTGIEVANPAFDVTPPELVTAIITERGVLHPPFRDSLANFALAAPSIDR